MKKNYKIQILRALAIIAVVLIHTCPLGLSQVLVRPFINFSVGLFLFLSGYLTKLENNDWKKFYKKRIIRVLVPYIIWTVIYSVLHGFDIKRLLINLITSKATGTLYYIPVYIQFVLLTPVLAKLITSKYRWIGWVITPLALIIFKYIWLILGMPLNKYISAIWDVSCLGWFIYYYLGLFLGNGLLKRKINIKKTLILFIISIPLQMLESYIWLSMGEVNCGTQLKLTACITSVLACVIAYYFITSDIKFKNNILISIGNYSFGIYLLHILIINVMNKIPVYSLLPYLVNSAIVLLVSYICVVVCNKICGNSISKWIGFV